jgi:hypothetical protein
LLRRIAPAAGACFVLMMFALAWAAPIARRIEPLSEVSQE